MAILGDFKENSLTGYGLIVKNYQIEYIGDFLNNKKHGEGKLYKNDILYYSGSFNQDIIEG